MFHEQYQLLAPNWYGASRDYQLTPDIPFILVVGSFSFSWTHKQQAKATLPNMVAISHK